MDKYIELGALTKYPIRLNHYDKEHGNIHFVYGIESVMEYAENLPAADVAPVIHGRWIVRFDGPYNRRRCYCSHCGKHNGVGGIAKNQEKPYCPHCSAKMDIKDGGDNDAVD